MDVPVTWRDATRGLPDAETTVLMCDALGEVNAGFYDGDDGWRDAATAGRVENAVIFWADFPMSPMEAAEKELARAMECVPEGFFSEGGMKGMLAEDWSDLDPVNCARCGNLRMIPSTEPDGDVMNTPCPSCNEWVVKPEGEPGAKQDNCPACNGSKTQFTGDIHDVHLMPCFMCND